MDDDLLLIIIAVFLFVGLPVALILGYRYRRRLFSNVQAISETAVMSLQNESRRRAMEQVQYAREDEKEEDEAGNPREPRGSHDRDGRGIRTCR